jgi:acyl-CoA thioesterase II
MKIEEFLKLAPSATSGEWLLPVRRELCGGRDSIFGGCALAASIEVAERETRRPLIWATCQFVRPARLDSVVTLSCVVSAAGRAVSHVRVTGTVAGEEMFICLLSTGQRSYPAQATHARMPDVPGPEGLPPRYILGTQRGGIRATLVELAVTDDPTGIMRSDDGRAAVWISLPGGIPANASALALIGDEVSTGTSAVVHPDAQAPSVDNTLRVVHPKATAWVLADIEVRAIANGFAHGIVNLWSPDGELLGIAEQTGALRIRGK